MKKLPVAAPAAPVVEPDEPISLPIAKICSDGGTQVRSQLTHAHMTRLADALRAGAVLPPITVFYDGTTYWLADGWHRLWAHRHVKREEIVCDVKTGTKEDAIVYAAGANATHGLPRTATEERRARSNKSGVPFEAKRGR